MFNKITEISKKMLKDVGKIDWDSFKEEIDPLLNKKTELFKYIEKHEKKQQLNTCNICDSNDMYPANRKRKNGELYTVMRCNNCGSCNLEDEDNE